MKVALILMNIISKWIEDFKAWRRNEVRAHHGDVRGRVFEKADPGKTAKVGKLTMVSIKVTRANGDVEEH